MTIAYTEYRDIVMVLDDEEIQLAEKNEGQFFENWEYELMEEFGSPVDYSQMHVTFLDGYNGYVYTVYFDINWEDFKCGSAYIVKGKRLDELGDAELEELAWNMIKNMNVNHYHFEYEWEKDGKKLDK